MPITTKYYFLEAFIEGDAYLAVADKRRFSTIDNQLWRIAEIIGDGRIDGWEVEETTFPEVRVTAGSGIIDGYFINTFDDQLFELSANGVFYFFAQRRVGITGAEGPKSELASVGYTDAGPPADVTGFALSSPDPFTVFLEWTANTDDDLDHYDIERSEDGIDYELIDTADSDDISYEDSVDEDTTYYYRFYAVDQSGNRSTTAATGTITTALSTSPPPNPLEVLMERSEYGINVLWKRPPMDFTKVQEYRVTWNAIAPHEAALPREAVPVSFPALPSGEFHTVNRNLYYDRIDELTPGQQYRVTLQTIDTKGRVSTGVERIVTPQPTPAPPDPTGIAWSFEEAPSGVQINLSWIEGDTPYDPATSYRFKIYLTVDGQSPAIGMDVPIGLTQEQINLYTLDLVNYLPIPEDTLVTIRLTALDEAGHESFGAWVRFETALLTLPRRLRDISAEFDPGTQSILVEWSNWPETDDVRIEIFYDNLEDAYVGDQEILDTYLGKAERYLLENVELESRYTFHLTPYNEDDIAGPTTAVVELTVIPDGLPLPEPPRNIEVKSGDGQVTLNWDQSVTAYTSAYQLYRKVGPVTVDEEDWTLLDEMDATILTFTDFGLQNDQIYSYYIAATDVYGRESLHLPDGAINLNFVEVIPKQEGILTPPTNVDLTLLPTNRIFISWESLLEEFDAFSIYRSINNLHSWELLATVPKDQFSYTDIELPLVDGTVFYYVVSKTFNDSDIVVQSTGSAPENSIYLATVTTDGSSIVSIDVSDRRDIKDLEDPLAEYTNTYLLPHRHREILAYDPDRIDLNPQLIVTDWTTYDGRIWFTEEEDISGTGYIVKIDGRIPSVFYSVDAVGRRLIFSEPVASVDEFGEIEGDPPEIEVRVLGVEEVQNVLDDNHIEGLHARQVQIGEMAKSQIPEINHEGRIRETLLPKRFLLERLSNYQFIVPQGDTDSTKNFGDGTTFYAVTESDGLIERMFDFDLQDDDTVVGFRRPDFADDTIANLKQNVEETSAESNNDMANNYVFDSDYLWGLGANNFWVFNKLSTSLAATDIVAHGLSNLRDLTLNKDNDTVYTFSSATGADASTIYTLDLGDGTFTSVATIDLTGTLANPAHMRALEYNPSDRKYYCIIADSAPALANHKLGIIDIDAATYTEIGDLPDISIATYFMALAYDDDANKMYAITQESPSEIYEVNLTSPISSVSVATTSQNNLRSLVYDFTPEVSDHPFYSMRAGANLEAIRLSDGDTTNVGVLSLARTAQGLVAPPEDLSFYIVGSDSSPGADRLRLGDFVGFQSTTFLRFPVNASRYSLVSSANLIVTAHQSEASAGDNVRLKISILDPAGFADSVDLQSESIKAVSTVGNVTWVPSAWSLGEQSSATTVDVTSLVQTFMQDDNYFEGRHIIFKIETLSTTTQNHHRTIETYGSLQPILEVSYTVASAGVDSDTGGFQSNKSYRLAFEFADSEPTRWVRVTSEDAPIKPNPIIDLGKRLRFRILNTEASVYLTLGIRETGQTTGEVGGDGGTSGPIEWVGLSEVLTDDFGNRAPKGQLIPASDDWQEVDIDLTRAGIKSYLNGDGILSRGYGVLEHLGFTVNPDDANGTGPFVIYIDEMEQISDVLVAGTSQGILVSRDFGVNWTLTRLTTTPVHKFYRSTNGFLWAITANEVLLAVDPAYWFVVGGTTGVQYIRDITEDADRDMYISTDKGVYWLEVTLLNRFAQFRQAQPINAFSTDAYALYHYHPSSGIDEIWVSTEVGVYKTVDKGRTWIDTGMDTSGLVAYQMFNISSSPDDEVIVACTRKHILRKLVTDMNFQTIADFEEQHDIFDIWIMELFAGRLYVSTGSGVYMNRQETLSTPGATDIDFERVLPDLNRNGFTGVVFGLNSVDMGDLGEKLFLGQENRLMTASESNVLRLKREWNKEMPSFFIDDEEKTLGFIYNSFNNVVCFREPVQANSIVSAAYLPRRVWIAINGGWAFTQPEAEVFIYRNGFPTWLDWELSDADIISELQAIEGQLQALPDLTDFNSLQPEATTYKNAVLADITAISTINEDTGENGVNTTNLVQFMDDYSRFLKLIIPALRDREVDGERIILALPPITLAGIRRVDRQSGSRAELLEEKEDFEADDATGITIDVTTGAVDFLQAYANATSTEDREKFTFEKFERMEATIFNANVQNTGEYTHRELETAMEEVNSGLTSHLARATYTNFIKAGIFMEGQHHYMFDRYNASNIQSKYYAAHTNSWYDVLNSTIDYDMIVQVNSLASSRFATSTALFTEDPYFNNKIWVGTDANILQYRIESNGNLTLEDIVLPGGISGLYIWDIYVFRIDTVYVVAENPTTREGILYRTDNFGTTWSQEEVIDLPERFYNLRIIGGNLVAGAESGVYYSDNNFGQWYACTLVNAGTDATTAFQASIRNIHQATFLIAESDRYFYRSGSGLEFFSTGRITNNGATSVNAIVRHKDLTFVGTDVGLYNDGNSILSDSISFSLEEIDEDIETSVAVEVNDVVAGEDALYCCGSNAKIYRFYDEGEGEGNVWKSYQLEDFGSIHRMLLHETSDEHWLYVFSYDQIRVIDVTPDQGVFG
jgi:hypothetical protein